MKNKKVSTVSRRTALSWLAGAGAGLYAGGGRSLSRIGWAQSSELPKFLIVFGCAGGASIIDGPLAMRDGEVGQAGLNSFPDQDVDGDLIRATQVTVDSLGGIPYRGTFDQRDFVNQYRDQMAVLTYTGTSVNHQIAQKRSLTGNEAWGGRTIQEAVASQFGQEYLLPNVNMATSGYAEAGHDPTLPAYARAETISSPLLWPLGLHGTKGVTKEAQPQSSVIDKARAWRNQALDQNSHFMRTFASDTRIQRWLAHRNDTMPRFEELDLITRLNMLRDSPIVPLNEFGLGSAEDQMLLSRSFPNILTDPLEAQAALAYLLISQGISVTVTISPDFSPLVMRGSGQLVDSPPLAFDFSHQAHRATQALMWSRMYSICHELISLLSQREFADGVSYWDRSMIYFASEFGRTRVRPENATDFGTGHDLNNGALLISPLIRGGQVYGGVDASTTKTFGFDPVTGTPTPGREMSEAELFSAIAHGLNLDVGGVGLPTVTALRA